MTNPPEVFDDPHHLARGSYDWSDIFLLFARNCGWDKDTVLDMTPAQIKIYLRAAERETKREDMNEWKRSVASGQAFRSGGGGSISRILAQSKEGLSLGGQPIS